MNNFVEKQAVIKDLLISFRCKLSEDSNQTLLFLHGWRSNKESWNAILKYFESSNSNIYLLDFPGFGKSQTPSRAFNVQDYCDFVEEFIQKNKLENITFVGHSFGGRVTIKMAATKPQLVKDLILVDAAGVKEEDLSMKSKKVIAKIVKPIFNLPFMKSVRNKIYKKMGAEDYVATPELKETFINVINEDLSDHLEKIAQNTLLIWGENDDATPVSQAKIMQEKIKNSKLIVVPDAGHFSFVDKPEVVGKEILNFIQK